MYNPATDPFDVRAYYRQITAVDIGVVAREVLRAYIKDEQGSTIFVDCPRHKSSSHRSFHIWTDKQGWYCHGCGVGGDVLQLVEFIQSGKVTTGQTGVMPDSHKKAREWLAVKVGLPPLGQVGLTPKEIKKMELARSLTLRAWECLTATTQFYNQMLLEDSEVINWISDKYSFDEKTIQEFQIGYADNTGLIDYLLKAGFTLREMTASGAFRPDYQIDEIVHPVFEKRIIFPYLSRGRTVFMIARKTPWTPNNKYEAGKYKKLPVHDPQKRRYIAEGIDNGTLYNEDILTTRPDYVIITEGITDCISLICRGFPTISPVTVNIRGNDWDRIIPKLRGVKKVILCQDNEISEAGWNGAQRSAARLSKENISCRIAVLPLGEEQESARSQLEEHNIHSGIEPKALKAILEEKSLKEWTTVEKLIEQAKIDVCSFFVSGKTTADFQQVIDAAFLPVEYAIQSIPDSISDTDRTELLNNILADIGHQPKVDQDHLLKALQKKTGEKLTSLRAQMKDAVRGANIQKREKIKRQIERKLGTPAFRRGTRTYYLVDNAIIEQSERDTPEGPIVNSQTIANFHIRITEEELCDDGEVRDDGSTTAHKILIGKIHSKDWETPFRIEAHEWGSNAKLASKITDQAGTQALFSTRDMDTIRLVSSVSCEPPKQKTVYSIFGVHPKAGFVSPTLTINDGEIIPTAETGAIVNVGNAYAKAQRLDLETSSEDEVREVVQHLLAEYMELQPREIILLILAHAFLGPLLFGMNLVGEFPPYILFLTGPSGKGKTETAKFAQSIWGNFQIKEHLASWGSTPEINRQEAARCRGALWMIDDFKRQKIGPSQWSNAIRVLNDYADLQARKRATPGSKVITGYPMKCMLLVTGEDVPTTETSLLARSLLIEFNGKKDMKTFRNCLKRQKDYRKIPAHYIAWLQKQDREIWKDQTRQYLDSFTTLIDSHDLNTDNSRRLASNAALSAVGLHAFLEFAQSIEAVDEEYAHTLRADHWKILCAVLEKMLLEVNEIKPGNIFISVLEELIHAKRVKILENYAEYHTDRNVPVIGYFRNNKEVICLFPKTTMAIVRDAFRRSEDESLNFSTAAIGKQLVEDGYIIQPEGKRLTFLERIPGAGRKTHPTRVWKFHAHKIKGMKEE